MIRKKQLKQEKAKDSEILFENFCKKNSIECEKVDSFLNKNLRSKFLIKQNGKCPDFWCKKNGEEIFVEIKTITNLTNQKREHYLDEVSGKNVPIDVFNPADELKGPLETFLKDASKKFKNLKKDINQPRILFIEGIFANSRFILRKVFLGVCDSYKRGGIYDGLKKVNVGLFDKTGSNVSAIIYWDKESNCFGGIENFKAKIFFSDNKFDIFFDKTKIY